MRYAATSPKGAAQTTGLAGSPDYLICYHVKIKRNLPKIKKLKFKIAYYFNHNAKIKYF